MIHRAGSSETDNIHQNNSFFKFLPSLMITSSLTYGARESGLRIFGLDEPVEKAPPKKATFIKTSACLLEKNHPNKRHLEDLFSPTINTVAVWLPINEQGA
ncbi:hypothetical protein CEXT_455941 [Caerostris extrusa]|uniref:Uncharacterized protein n=1 Tax=Caerostris extrusa TaxID=172846 RepID=A0AAV4RHI5_CAEEX|nr:hypothetical protein CEXT_455941 [Caerostris extrusa]